METCMGAVWFVWPFRTCFKGSKFESEEGRAETVELAKTSRAISWLVGCDDAAGEFSGAVVLVVELEESTISAGSVLSATAVSCATRRLSRFWTAALMDALCPAFCRQVRYILNAADDFRSGEVGSCKRLILWGCSSENCTHKFAHLFPACNDQLIGRIQICCE